MYCCNRIHVRFTTQRTHTPTCTHTNTLRTNTHTNTQRNNKVGNPEAGNYLRNSPTSRCVLTHPTRWLQCQRVQARSLPPPHRLVLAVLPPRTRWQLERPSTRCLRQTTPSSSIKNTSTQSPTLQSKCPEQ